MSDEAKALAAAIRQAMKQAKEPEEELDMEDFLPLPPLEEDWELLDIPEEPAPTEPSADRLKRIMVKRGVR